MSTISDFSIALLEIILLKSKKVELLRPAFFLLKVFNSNALHGEFYCLQIMTNGNIHKVHHDFFAK